jgi:DNA-binding LacI/PurR family transcriptional regulator
LSQFVYKFIEQELKRRIESGRYAPNERIGGSKELAGEFQSSTGTVDKALQNLASNGYLRRTQRQGTFVNPPRFWMNPRDTRAESHLIGAIVFDSSYPYIWGPAIRGIEQESERNSYHLVIGNDEGDPRKARRYIDNLLAKGIDGFVFVPIGMPDKEQYESVNLEIVNYFRANNVPFVLFHRHLESTKCTAVVSDNYHDTRRLIAEFLDEGISSPICLSHHYSSVARAREVAFADELRDRGFADAEQRVFKLHPHPVEVDESNVGEIQSAYSSIPDVDGVFTVGSHVLHAARYAAEGSAAVDAHKTRFATFDHSPETLESENVRMTMIQPNFEMGRLAADLLLKQLADFHDLQMVVTVSSRLMRYNMSGRSSLLGDIGAGNA